MTGNIQNMLLCYSIHPFRVDFFQVNNFQLKTSRVVFGPDLVVLGPDENFDVLSLSGTFKIEVK